MATTLYVKPATAGLRVPGPDGRDLPADGAVVPRIGFWLRRVADGDVVEATPPTATVPTTKTTKTKSSVTTTETITAADAAS